MGQPVLIALLAIAIAVTLTAALAFVTLTQERATRAIELYAAGTIIAVGIVVLGSANLRVNFTASMPIGIYAVSPLPPGDAKRGTLVVACAPARAAKIGERRGYLTAGPCADNTELLLKTVAAAPGDEVDVTSTGVAVNGCQLPQSRPAVRDRSGRDLARWPLGRYHMGSVQLWLYAANDRSWDSRYWGPVSGDDIKGKAAPLVVFPAGSALASGRPPLPPCPSQVPRQTHWAQKVPAALGTVEELAPASKKAGTHVFPSAFRLHSSRLYRELRLSLPRLLESRTSVAAENGVIEVA